MATDAGTILSRIKDEEIEWVDLRFTDPKGKWQHLTMAVGRDRRGQADRRLHVRRQLDRRLEGDQRKRHDPEARPRRGLCRPVQRDPDAGPVLQRRRTVDRRALRPRPALDRDPRRGLSQGRPASATPSSSAPKPNSSCSTTSASRTATTPAAYRIDDIELPTNTGREYEGGNLAHRPRAKGGYFPVAPVDSAMDIRGEMVSTMLEMGLPWTSTTTRSPPPSTSSA